MYVLGNWVEGNIGNLSFGYWREVSVGLSEGGGAGWNDSEGVDMQ